MTDRQILTVPQAARLLNASERQVERLLRDQALRSVRVDGEWHLRRKDLEAYLSSHFSKSA
jgi:excisionase family DNA binding protein